MRDISWDLEIFMIPPISMSSDDAPADAVGVASTETVADGGHGLPFRISGYILGYGLLSGCPTKGPIQSLAENERGLRRKRSQGQHVVIADILYRIA